MQQFQFAPGDTSQSIDIFLPNSSSTTGAGLSGLVFNTASLAAYYRNTATGTVTGISLATQTVGGAYSSGGFVELDNVHAVGMYRLDLPTAVLTSAGNGFVYIYGATNLAPTPVQIVVKISDVNAKNIGGTPQTGRDIGASVLLSPGTGTGQISLTSGAVTVGTNNDKTGYSLTATPPTAAAIATAVWTDTTGSDFTTASSIGKSLYNAFTSNTSVYTTAALANAPTGGSSPSAIATAVWQDLLAGGDFGTAGSIGSLLSTQIGNVAGVTMITALRRIGATTAGLLPSGAGTTTESFQDFAGASCVSFTVDSSGNRTSVVYS